MIKKITTAEVIALQKPFIQKAYIPRPSADYGEYIKSEWWQKVSWACKWMYGMRCAVCNSAENLNAHHKTYERKGFEHPEDLICLCNKCHAKFHDKLENR